VHVGTTTDLTVLVLLLLFPCLELPSKLTRGIGHAYRESVRDSFNIV
jgi:hypothetical protein